MEQIKWIMMGLDTGLLICAIMLGVKLYQDILKKKI